MPLIQSESIEQDMLPQQDLRSLSVEDIKSLWQSSKARTWNAVQITHTVVLNSLLQKDLQIWLKSVGLAALVPRAAELNLDGRHLLQLAFGDPELFKVYFVITWVS